MPPLPTRQLTCKISATCLSSILIIVFSDVVILQDCTESQQPYIDTVRKHVKDAISMIKSQVDLKGGSARNRNICWEVL